MFFCEKVFDHAGARKDKFDMLNCFWMDDEYSNGRLFMAIVQILDMKRDMYV